MPRPYGSDMAYETIHFIFIGNIDHLQQILRATAHIPALGLHKPCPLLVHRSQAVTCGRWTKG